MTLFEWQMPCLPRTAGATEPTPKNALDKFRGTVASLLLCHIEDVKTNESTRAHLSGAVKVELFKPDLFGPVTVESGSTTWNNTLSLSHLDIVANVFRRTTYVETRGVITRVDSGPLNGDLDVPTAGSHFIPVVNSSNANVLKLPLVVPSEIDRLTAYVFSGD